MTTLPKRPDRDARSYLRAVDEHFFREGGEPPGGDMEARMTRLEGKMDRVEDRLGKVETGLAVLVERVSHLPSKGFIVASTMGALAFLTAVILFADKIKPTASAIGG